MIQKSNFYQKKVDAIHSERCTEVYLTVDYRARLTHGDFML